MTDRPFVHAPPSRQAVLASTLLLFIRGMPLHAFVGPASRTLSLQRLPLRAPGLPQDGSGILCIGKLDGSRSSLGVGDVNESNDSARKSNAVESSGDVDRVGDEVTVTDEIAERSSDAAPSEMTDRFKYKVHALMGDYDPPAGTTNDENQMGSIIGSLLQFPTEYTFSVVGRTGGPATGSDSTEGTDEGDSTTADIYADQVKYALASVVGSDTELELLAIPRGKNFTRVSCKITVESASMVTSIYEELDALDMTVMKF